MKPILSLLVPVLLLAVFYLDLKALFREDVHERTELLAQSAVLLLLAVLLGVLTQ